MRRRMLASLGGAKPPYLRRVICLIANGKQRIDTGYVPTNETRFDATAKIDSVTSTSQIVFGRVGVTTGNTSRFWLGAQGSSKKWYYAVNNYVATNISADSEKHTFSVDLNEKNVKVDDEVIATFTQSLNYNADPVSLLCAYRSGSSEVLNSPMSGRIYGAEIFENGIPQKRFVPVIDFDGNPAMYDELNDEFKYNIGTGSLGWEEEDGTIVVPT